MTATAQTRPVSQTAVAGPAAAVTPAQAQTHEAVEALARRLRLPYLRAQLDEVLAAARSQRWDPAEVVRVLLDAEACGRDAATIASRRRAAGFAQGKTFDSWNAAASSIPAAAQQALMTLEWVARHEKLCVAGPSGTGKSHFLEALGHHAIDQGCKVTWTTLEALGGLVRRHRVDDSVAKAITRLLRVDLVVVDDIGLLPVGGDAAEAFYRLIDAAYEKRSLAISSNVHPAGFDELMPTALATAGVDRLLHHAHVILTQGDSHRLREATSGKGGDTPHLKRREDFWWPPVGDLMIAYGEFSMAIDSPPRFGRPPPPVPPDSAGDCSRTAEVPIATAPRPYRGSRLSLARRRTGPVRVATHPG